MGHQGRPVGGGLPPTPALRRRNGNARVPRDYEVDGYRLGEWVRKQRHTNAKGTLDADRQHRLEALPGWTWDARDYAGQWEEGFRQLRRYADETGNARVPGTTR